MGRDTVTLTPELLARLAASDTGESIVELLRLTSADVRTIDLSEISDWSDEDQETFRELVESLAATERRVAAVAVDAPAVAVASKSTWSGFGPARALEIEPATSDDRFGRFFAQPIERGFGTTLGNAMRRALLSSIDGAAITAVRITGALHEFSQIEGVIEDATDIILNIKQLPVRAVGDSVKTLTLRRDRPGIVRAGDIAHGSDVEILEPDAHLATVSEGGRLEMEFRVKIGRGYVAADRNFDEDLGIGWIPIDSVHSPIKKVNYLVEALRVGGDTDYEKLTLEVWTNGAVTPADAVVRAAERLRNYLRMFESAAEGLEAVPVFAVASMGVHLDRSIEELELSVRSYNVLKNANIVTIRELVSKTEADLLRNPHMNRKSLNEIKELLEGMSLSLGMSVAKAEPDAMS